MKKPIYKRVWFWVIIFFLVGGIASEANKNKNDGELVKKSDAKTTNAEPAKEETTFYGIGQTIAASNIEYTLKSVELTPKRNQFSKKQPALVVKITYVVKNNSSGELSVGMGTEVYGSDNKKADSYPNGSTYDKVAPGMEIECYEHFGINQGGDIQINLNPRLLGRKMVFKAHV